METFSSAPWNWMKRWCPQSQPAVSAIPVILSCPLIVLEFSFEGLDPGMGWSPPPASGSETVSSPKAECIDGHPSWSWGSPTWWMLVQSTSGRESFSPSPLASSTSSTGCTTCTDREMGAPLHTGPARSRAHNNVTRTLYTCKKGQWVNERLNMMYCTVLLAATTLTLTLKPWLLASALQLLTYNLQPLQTTSSSFQRLQDKLQVRMAELQTLAHKQGKCYGVFLCRACTA